MMIFGNYNITTRVRIIISIFMSLIILLAVVGILTLNIMEERLEETAKKSDVKLRLIKHMRSLAQGEQNEIKNILFLKQNKKQLQRFIEKKEQYEKIQDILIVMTRNNNEIALIEKAITSKNKIYSLWDKILKRNTYSEEDESDNRLLNEEKHIFTQWIYHLNKMISLENEAAKTDVKNTINTYNRLRNVMIFVSIFSAIAGIYFVLSFTSSITIPLFDIAEKINKIAQGDFSVNINYNKNDEISMVAHQINHMTKMLKSNEDELRNYRIHLEELVRQRTETLNLQREKFISVLIHDLKGPLTPIQGFTKRLINGKSKSQKETMEYLNIIHEASLVMYLTIENTSHILREKSDFNSFNIEEVNFKDIFLSVNSNTLPAIEDKGIVTFINNRTKEKWHDLEDLFMKGDSFQLKRLIENLLGNAVKYAQKMIKEELYKTNSEIHLVICDDGPGIPMTFQEKIFDEYFQVPGSKKGTGLGLYSVKKVVDNHKGKIFVNSSSHKGTTFEVILPV